MTACDQCFRDFLHPLVHASIDKNERFKERYGNHPRWDWDSDSALLAFSNRGNVKLRIRVSIAGTTEGDSWEWSWANKNLDAFLKLDMDRVREFGEANGFEMLTSPFLEADEHTGWEMTAVAVHVLDALGSYRFPTEHGFCYLVYREIEFSDRA
jgi:uncharacterized protein DUF6882